MKYFKKNFEFDYAAVVKWDLRTLGDIWKSHKYNLRGEYFFPNKRKAEIMAANPSDIPPVEWTAFVDHYMDLKTMKQCLQNVKNHKKLIVSHAGGSKSNARRATQMEKKSEKPICWSEVIVSTLLKKDRRKIAEHFPKDQERAATEGIHSKVLAHLDDLIGKVCGFENIKRVHGFSNVACPSGLDSERQLQEAKDQVATLHIFLQ
ncbi:hypothetical protein Ahy_A05g024713 [Arachis hypogaea]|uniref:Uncharacterized protein n=1 Tax=Arachis hypogaea TaxID=3818 RepID=A0A445D6T8_ARAHY|nr:hypothetical protein Ahy_A05g024713 [Arachis hypogaea]